MLVNIEKICTGTGQIQMGRLSFEYKCTAWPNVSASTYILEGYITTTYAASSYRKEVESHIPTSLDLVVLSIIAEHQLDTRLLQIDSESANAHSTTDTNEKK